MTRIGGGACSEAFNLQLRFGATVFIVMNFFGSRVLGEGGRASQVRDLHHSRLGRLRSKDLRLREARQIKIVCGQNLARHCRTFYR